MSISVVKYTENLVFILEGMTKPQEVSLLITQVRVLLVNPHFVKKVLVGLHFL